MKEIKWNALKNERLKKARGVSFDDFVNLNPILIREHPSKSHQDIIYFYFRDYIWLVPYVETEEMVFWKTLYPSRKHTKLFKKGRLI